MTHRATFRYWGEVDPRGRTPIGPRAEQPVTESSPWTMYLYEPIDSYGGYWGVSASEVAAALRGIPADADLLLRINSPGGEVTEASAIASLLRSRAGTTHAMVDGLAASAASYLAVVAETCTMGAEAMMMIHKPWGLTVGDDSDHLSTAGLLGTLGDTYAGAYARKAGGELATWLDAMAAETWYTAAEAVAVGLADKVQGAEQDDAEPALDELGVAAAALSPVYLGLLGRGPLAQLTAVAAAPAVVPPPAAEPAPTIPAPAPPAAGPKIDMRQVAADLRSALERS